MSQVWSIDDFLIGGMVMLPDTIDEMFEMELNPDSFLFYPGGKIGAFCSYNTRYIIICYVTSLYCIHVLYMVMYRYNAY